MEKNDVKKYDDHTVVRLSWNCDENVISWEKLMLFEIFGFLGFLYFYLTTPCKHLVVMYCEIFSMFYWNWGIFLSALIMANYETLSKGLTAFGYPKILCLFTTSVLWLVEKLDDHCKFNEQWAI